MCGGVQLHVTDRSAFEPYLTGITAISTVRMMYPDRFAWRDPPYEYEAEKLPIEILCGGRDIPRSIENGEAPGDIRASWQSDVAEFLKTREKYLLY